MARKANQPYRMRCQNKYPVTVTVTVTAGRLFLLISSKLMTEGALASRPHKYIVTVTGTVTTSTRWTASRGECHSCSFSFRRRC